MSYRPKNFLKFGEQYFTKGILDLDKLFFIWESEVSREYQHHCTVFWNEMLVPQLFCINLIIYLFIVDDGRATGHRKKKIRDTLEAIRVISGNLFLYERGYL